MKQRVNRNNSMKTCRKLHLSLQLQPWEGSYRANVVDSETYLLTLMRYIEMNPVRAGGSDL